MPYGGTGRTVEEMLVLATGDRGSRSLELRLALEDLVRHLAPRDQLSQMAAVYYYLDRHWHFFKDPKRVEQVKDPVRMLEEIRQHGRALGDCDDATTFLTGSNEALGITADIVRTGFTPLPLGAVKGRFTHVLSVGYDQYGRPVVLDPVAGPRVRRMLARVRQHTALRGVG